MLQKLGILSTRDNDTVRQRESTVCHRDVVGRVVTFFRLILAADSIALSNSKVIIDIQ